MGIDAFTQGEQLVIEVWDEGIGIVAEDLEKVFNPFEQVTQTYSGKPDGTGLGLAIARRLVRAHGGTLTVDSAVGVGSRFRIALPSAVKRLW